MQNEKFTMEKIEQHLQDWQESGLSKKEYCRQRGIKHHLFSYWFSRATIKQDASFVPLEPSINEEIIIVSPAGIQVKLPLNNSTVHFVKQLLSY